MSLFSRVVAPRPLSAPATYDVSFMAQMANVLNLFFQQINAVQPLNISGLNIDIARLPTEAALATLRVGDVYRYTVDNSLRIKV